MIFHDLEVQVAFLLAELLISPRSDNITKICLRVRLLDLISSERSTVLDFSQNNLILWQTIALCNILVFGKAHLLRTAFLSNLGIIFVRKRSESNRNRFVAYIKVLNLHQKVGS